MASGCVSLKTNTHFPNSKKGSFFGERIKGSLKNSSWVTTQKKIKPASFSAILTSDDPKGSLVNSVDFFFSHYMT